jgi:ketosteroid isomerase-like protein
MSQENVEIVRRVYDAAARRDTETVLALYDEEVEWDMSRGAWADLEGGGVHYGHAGLRDWWRRQLEIWEKWEDSPDEVIEAGEQVVSVVISRSRGRTSGADVESNHAAVWTLRDGRVLRVEWFPSRAEALEAVGLAE